jgi:hypothetical protein
MRFAAVPVFVRIGDVSTTDEAPRERKPEGLHPLRDDALGRLR